MQAEATEDNMGKMTAVAEEVVDMWITMMQDPERTVPASLADRVQLQRLDNVLLTFQSRDPANTVCCLMTGYSLMALMVLMMIRSTSDNMCEVASIDADDPADSSLLSSEHSMV